MILANLKGTEETELKLGPSCAITFRVKKYLTDDLVKHEMSRILSSPLLNKGGRPANMLRYIVEEALAGRGDKLDSYSIGTRVFGKGPEFKPQSDPIVRVNALRLRKILTQYYEVNSAGGVEICLPEGSYKPIFDFRKKSTDLRSFIFSPTWINLLERRTTIFNFDVLSVISITVGLLMLALTSSFIVMRIYR